MIRRAYCFVHSSCIDDRNSKPIQRQLTPKCIPIKIQRILRTNLIYHNVKHFHFILSWFTSHIFIVTNNYNNYYCRRSIELSIGLYFYQYMSIHLLVKSYSIRYILIITIFVNDRCNFTIKSNNSLSIEFRLASNSHTAYVK